MTLEVTQTKTKLLCEFDIVMLWLWIIHECVSKVICGKIGHYFSISMDQLGVIFMQKLLVRSLLNILCLRHVAWDGLECPLRLSGHILEGFCLPSGIWKAFGWWWRWWQQDKERLTTEAAGMCLREHWKGLAHRKSNARWEGCGSVTECKNMLQFFVHVTFGFHH